MGLFGPVKPLTGQGALENAATNRPPKNSSGRSKTASTCSRPVKAINLNNSKMTGKLVDCPVSGQLSAFRKLPLKKRVLEDERTRSCLVLKKFEEYYLSSLMKTSNLPSAETVPVIRVDSSSSTASHSARFSSKRAKWGARLKARIEAKNNADSASSDDSSDKNVRYSRSQGVGMHLKKG